MTNNKENESSVLRWIQNLASEEYEYDIPKCSQKVDEINQCYNQYTNPLNGFRKCLWKDITVYFDCTRAIQSSKHDQQRSERLERWAKEAEQSKAVKKSTLESEKPK